MFDRFATCVERFWDCLDQLACVIIRSPFYILFDWGGAPSADRTISAYVGIKAETGHKWALVAEKIIDGIMLAKGHCRGAIARDARD